MSSKESAVALAALLVLRDPTWRRWHEWTACAAGLAGAFALRAAALWGGAPAPTPLVDNPLLGADLLAWQATAWDVLGCYLLLLVWRCASRPSPLPARRVDAAGLAGDVRHGPPS